MIRSDEDRLIEKLQKIEALYARAGTPGEKIAAGSARDRILHRLKTLERTEQPIEYRFSLPDDWSRTLFIALLRRYDLKPYRYSGQRRTTVMARVTRSFVDEVLWPEYQQFNQVLRMHLESVTQRIVAQAIDDNQTDAEERPEKPSSAGDVPGHIPR